MVAKGNPEDIKTQQDLCGKAVAAETGTTEVDYLNGTGDYKGQGLSSACTKAGKAKIDVKDVPEGQRRAPRPAGRPGRRVLRRLAGRRLLRRPAPGSVRAVGASPLGVAKEGISVAEGPAGAPRRPSQRPCSSMVNDGTYLQILQKYGLEDGAVTANVVK